jgi:hypothetical protein
MRQVARSNRTILGLFCPKQHRTIPSDSPSYQQVNSLVLNHGT